MEAQKEALGEGNRSYPLLISPRIDGFRSSTHPTRHCFFVGWVELSETHRRAGREGSEWLSITLVTKPDIDRLERKLLEHDGEFKLLKWMLGLILAAEVMPWLIRWFA